MKILGLDLSTKTGWAVLQDGKLVEYGKFTAKIVDFNVNDFPNKSKHYPQNLIHAANDMISQVMYLIRKVDPDLIALENTVKGRNRHTQRWLEWLHKTFWDEYPKNTNNLVTYLDPSEWRNLLAIKMSAEDKKNNRLVNQGKKRGKVTKKHLSLRTFEELFGIKLKVKENDEAEATLMAYALYLKVKDAEK